MNRKVNRFGSRRVDDEITVKPDNAPDLRMIRLHVDYLRRTGATDETQKHRGENLRRLSEALTCLLLDATQEILEDWHSWTSRRVSLSSLATYTSHTRAFYRWAVEAGHLDIDPATRLPQTKVPARQPRPMPVKDLEFALACATEPLLTWLILGAFMGLRAGEIARIRHEDIEEGILDGARRLFLNGYGKGRKPFKLPVPVAVAPYLQGHMSGRTGPIFRTARGTPMRRAYVSVQTSEFFERLGMPWTMHNARHTFGTHVQRETGDMLQTQILMRHSNLNTTRLYVEPVTAPGVAAMDRLAGKQLRQHRRPTGEVA